LPSIEGFQLNDVPEFDQNYFYITEKWDETMQKDQHFAHFITPLAINFVLKYYNIEQFLEHSKLFESTKTLIESKLFSPQGRGWLIEHLIISTIDLRAAAYRNPHFKLKIYTNDKWQKILKSKNKGETASFNEIEFKNYNVKRFPLDFPTIKRLPHTNVAYFPLKSNCRGKCFNLKKT
jgi:hypothetical protein